MESFHRPYVAERNRHEGQASMQSRPVFVSREETRKFLFAPTSVTRRPHERQVASGWAKTVVRE
jgi:hypothetical protein